MLECYNVNIEEDDEDPQNIDILEREGCHEVQGPLIEDPDITVLLKTKQVNIGTKAEPKYAIVDKVTKLLHEYQDLFLTKIIELNGLLAT